ncbi:MAG: hypothetical protein HY556_07195 [Euryarchaeota archaeon]|nr:hypothetical protein [Euryarchaeota archaeon]
MAGVESLDERRLGEVIRQMERYVDHQITVAEELDDKIEQLLALAVASFGGGLALLLSQPTALVGGDPILTPSAALLVLSLVVNLISASLFLDAYVGILPARAPQIGPGADPAWLAEVALEPRWTMAHIQFSTIKGLKDRATENQGELVRVGSLRRLGLVALFVSLFLYGVVIFLR